MRVLVTGAGGFIGYNMCLYLLGKGHEVVASYRTNLPKENLLIKDKRYNSKIIFTKGDLLDKNYYRDLDKYNIDSVINAAVITSLEISELEAFIKMANANIQTTINLLDFSLNNKVKNHIYISSSGVYGSKCDIDRKIKEDDELDLFNTYCISKRSSELLVARYGHLTGTKAISARIAAPYGPYERTTTSRTVMSPIYKMINYALDDKLIKIYGKDIVRDWTYVNDTVASIYELLICKDTNYTEYNVSNSISYSLGEIALSIKKAMPNFKYIFVENPSEADIAMYPSSQRGALDISRIQKDTGFNPQYTIDKGIERYIEWAINKKDDRGDSNGSIA